MTKSDPIIAVNDVAKSSHWYQAVFGCKSVHGGNEFDVLKSENDEVLLCLHKWGEHDHPTMNGSTINAGKGFILYFRSHNIDEIWKKVQELGYPIEKKLELSPNSNKREFSIRDLDGYYLTISEYHEFQG